MKHAAEQHLRASGVARDDRASHRVPRAVDRVLEQTAARSGRPLVFGRGDNPINFVSVVDVAALVERAVTDPSTRGQTLEIGGPETSPSTSSPPRSRQPPAAPARHATFPRSCCGSWPRPPGGSSPARPPGARGARDGYQRPHRRYGAAPPDVPRGSEHLAGDVSQGDRLTRPPRRATRSPRRRGAAPLRDLRGMLASAAPWATAPAGTAAPAGPARRRRGRARGSSRSAPAS